MGINFINFKNFFKNGEVFMFILFMYIIWLLYSIKIWIYFLIIYVKFNKIMSIRN